MNQARGAPWHFRANADEGFDGDAILKEPDVRPPDPFVVVLKSSDWSDSVVHCTGIALITQCSVQKTKVETLVMQDLESADHVARLKVCLNEALARHVDQQHSHSKHVKRCRQSRRRAKTDHPSASHHRGRPAK